MIRVLQDINQGTKMERPTMPSVFMLSKSSFYFVYSLTSPYNKRFFFFTGSNCDIASNVI